MTKCYLTIRLYKALLNVMKSSLLSSKYYITQKNESNKTSISERCWILPSNIRKKCRILLWKQDEYCADIGCIGVNIIDYNLVQK